MVRTIEALDGFAKPRRGVTGPIAGIAASRAGFFHDMETGGARPHVRCHSLSDGKIAMALDDKTRTELEAAVFRRLVAHLRERTDVQNIDLMNLAGFCRNCLSNWLKDAADEKGVALSKDDSREAVYGMPYETWKATYQSEATPDQQAAFKKSHAGH